MYALVMVHVSFLETTDLYRKNTLLVYELSNPQNQCHSKIKLIHSTTKHIGDDFYKNNSIIVSQRLLLIEFKSG